jgi:hypothetical protein
MGHEDLPDRYCEIVGCALRDAVLFAQREARSRYASCISLVSFDDSAITFCATSGGICS